MSLNFEDAPPPDNLVRNEPMWKKETLNKFVYKEIQTSNLILPAKEKDMTTAVKDVQHEVEKTIEQFERTFDKLLATENKTAEVTKKVSSSVRSAANDLANGLTKIEKLANFENLERRVVLLERAAQALTVLAELETNGKLDKILDAVR